ncbi:MAG: hypothetical protein P4L49_14170 [Desulfosporosinus sp.]|nr:hypothetical protein [Desulfosporosinus sp.]
MENVSHEFSATLRSVSYRTQSGARELGAGPKEHLSSAEENVPSVL